MKDTSKEFWLSRWAINNRTAVYILTFLMCVIGLMAYNGLPKEKFPEIKFPQIIVQTIYPGTSPENMENLVTKHIEKQVKNITGVKKVTSNSFQDYSVVIVEFTPDISIDKAKVDVKDGVDKAKQDLPKNLPYQPEVKDIDLSEFPILSVNISGNYDLNRLKKYADKVQDAVESIKEVKRADMVGAPDREIQINVDLYKMQAAGLTFYDIQNIINSENLSASAGEVSMNKQKRVLSIKNEYKKAEEIANTIIRNQEGKAVYLKDIAEVRDDFEEQKSYARLEGKNVITLNIIKAKGKNLIDASDHVMETVERMKKESLPKDLKIVVTGDESQNTRDTLHDLINTIVIGFILVTLILMFFMGVTNALFVALSVPLSCALAFLFMPAIGFSLNMIVLFSFLLALGIVVDDAIVVIENTHRIFENGKVPIKKAALIATGEVFLPVLSGTATTLMPFVPLAFWNSIIGKFMFFLPITLIITLVASLLVAYVINPVFAVDFMKPHNLSDDGKRKWGKRDWRLLSTFVSLGVLCHLGQMPALANFILFIYAFILLEKFVLEKWIHSFQNKAWPAFVNWYARMLKGALKRPGLVMVVTILLLFVAPMAYVARHPPFTLFPNADPNFAYVYLNLPVGTDQAHTNEVLMDMEARVNKALDIDPAKGKTNPLVQSVISNVTVGAVDPSSGEVGDFPNKGRITVAFVGFAHRDGVNTWDYLKKIREAVGNVPGAEVTVDKEGSGPPTQKPISIEITGDDLDSLITTSERLKKYLDLKQIAGVEKLRSDFQARKPEIIFDLNRERMNNEGITTQTVVYNMRTAVFGSEVSRFRDDNDDYPINLRLNHDQRLDVDALRNLPIVYRDMGMGGRIRQVPTSSFANIDYTSTYGGIKRKDQKRIIILSSNLLTGYENNGPDVVAAVQREIDQFHGTTGVSIKMAGQQEDEKETGDFLGRAMGISMALIFLILVLQFNSLSRTLIIMSEVLFSIIGVFLGYAIAGNTFSMVMSGIGIVALAGIVVRNGILLVEFMDLMLKDGMTPYDAIVESGRTRMTPVVLTATAAILGLIPLATGMNIDFYSLLSTGNPHIFFGGDNTAFWAPLAWTMIYGLSFATILTLIVVPAMCLLSFRFKAWVKRVFGKKETVEGNS